MGKSVVVNFLAEATGFQTEVDKLEQGMEKVKGSANGVGLGLAAGLTAVGGAFVKFGEPIEQAEIKLKNVVQNSGGDFEAIKGQVDSTVSKMEKFGHGSADTQTALAELTAKLGDPKKAMADMGTVAELAAYKHISLADAALQVGKVMDGSKRVLKEFGISVDDLTKLATDNEKAQNAVATADDKLTSAKQKLTDLMEIQGAKSKLTISDQIALRNAQEAVTKATEDDKATRSTAIASQEYFNKVQAGSKDALTQLGDKLKGVAEDQANTFSGKMEAVRTKLEDFVGTVGKKVGPAMVELGPAFAGLGPALSLAGKGVGGLGAAFDFLAANPMVLVAVAIAGLVAGLVLAYNHVSWFRDFVQGAFHDVAAFFEAPFDFVKDHWPLLLGILTGPIGLAAVFIIEHWKGVGTFFSDLWAGIKEGVKDAVNFLVDALNVPIKAVDSVSGLLSKIPGVPNLQIPTIPHLAQGGIVTSPTLALIGEAGPERVTPLGGIHDQGGSITIVVQGSVISEGQLVRKIQAGLQGLGRTNVSALNGYA